MTAAEALRRLKDTGRLGASPPPPNALDASDVNTDVGYALQRAIGAIRATQSQRWLAPSVNHPVLP